MSEDTSQPARSPVSAIAPASEDAIIAPHTGRAVRVAWVAGGDTLVTYGRMLQPLSIGLLDELVELTALCPRQSPVGDLPCPPVQLVPYTLSRWFGRSRATVRSLVDGLVTEGVELLHALDASGAELTSELAQQAGLKYLLSSMSLDDTKRLGRLGDRCVAVLAATEPIRAALLRHGIARQDRIHLVRPGVYQVHHPTLFEHAQQSVTIVAGASRTDDASPMDAVLRCFGELHAHQYDCEYFIMGAGRAERELRRRAEQLKLSGVLTFVDRQMPTQLAGIFKAADIYIAAATERSIDINSLLAMASGDPVLSAGGGASDFVIDGKTATVFRAGDANDLTRKLQALLDDHDAARGMAQNALDYLHANHSPAGMVAEIAKLYRWAIGG